MIHTATTPSSALAAAIEGCYQAFGRYRVPAELDVCMPCCVAPEVEEQLRRLPLRQIPRHHLYDYNSSAKSRVQSAAEVGYFLPRLLELMALGERVHHSVELYLSRLGSCPAGSFSPAQWQAVQAVAQTIWAEDLGRFPWARATLAQSSTLFDTLLMWHIGGLDIQPLLDTWQRTDTPQATLQYAHAAWFGFWAKGRISNAFADNQHAYRQRMADWMQGQAHRITFARRLLALNLAHIPGAAVWSCGAYYTPETLTQCLIDALTRGLPDQALRQVLN